MNGVKQCGGRSARRRTAIAAAVLAAGSGLLGAAPSAAAAADVDARNLLPAGPTAAQTLPFGVWTGFSAGPTGSTSQVFTFSSRTPVLLRVTDAFCRGDEFRVLDRGFALFNTSTVGTDPSCDGIPHLEGPRAAWRDQSYSKGRFLLQPGEHSVTIRITDSPFGGAGAYLRIDRRPVR